LYVLPWGLLILFSPTWESFNETYKKRKQNKCYAEREDTKFLLFNTPNSSPHKKIGPHDHYIYDLIIGSLLSDGYGEKRNLATRIHILMNSPNVEYLMALHKFLSFYGYCSSLKPKIGGKKNIYIKKQNKVFFSIKYKTYSYTSFSPIYDLFYPQRVEGTNNLVPSKQIPNNIQILLSPLVLAILLMNNGTKTGSGLKLSCQTLTPSDVKKLCSAINLVFNLSSTLNKANAIYFPKKDLDRLKSIVEPHFVVSMLYIFN
jgi:hypothetical protein